MKNIYICDIDGTLSDFRTHRGPFDEHKVFDDIPLPTVEVIKSLISNGHKIIYISGRSDKCKLDTIKWLTKFISNDPPELYMRVYGDLRSDEIIKEEIYNTYIKDTYNVLGLFDDRLKVCRMWYKLGLFVFNCNQGLIEF